MSEPRWVHYATGSGDLAPRSVTQRWTPMPKPLGLWLSDESGTTIGWSEWTDGSNHYDLAHPFEVVIAADSNVLTLGTYAEAVDFTDAYARTITPPDIALPPSLERHIRAFAIDWARVAEDYQGIAITPYIWTARMRLLWYYGWDCASACIWDAGAIKAVTPIGTGT